MYRIEYTDLLVRNLLSIVELNTQLNEFLYSVDKHDAKYKDLEDSVNSEILFNYAYLLKIHVRFKDVRRFILGMNKTPENEKERLLLNIRNILDYINASFLAEKFGLGIMVHLNKLFLDEYKDVWDVGKLMSKGEVNDDTFDMFRKQEIVDQPHIHEYMRQVDEYYQASMMPDVIKNALIFYDLVHVHIFACGNDATMLGMLLFLYKKTEFNKYINYFKCIHEVITEGGTGKEVTEQVWVELFLHALVKELKEVKLRVIPFVDEVRSEEQKYVDLNLRQVKGLHYIKEKGRISREVYARLNNISQITSYRDLNSMLQKGYVRVEGIGKGTKYTL